MNKNKIIRQDSKNKKEVYVVPQIEVLNFELEGAVLTGSSLGPFDQNDPSIHASPRRSTRF